MKKIQKTKKQEMADTLRHIRRVKGLSISEISRISGISKPTLSIIEKGTHNYNIDSLLKLCKVIGADLKIINKNEVEII